MIELQRTCVNGERIDVFLEPAVRLARRFSVPSVHGMTGRVAVHRTNGEVRRWVTTEPPVNMELEVLTAEEAKHALDDHVVADIAAQAASLLIKNPHNFSSQEQVMVEGWMS